MRGWWYRCHSRFPIPMAQLVRCFASPTSNVPIQVYQRNTLRGTILEDSDTCTKEHVVVDVKVSIKQKISASSILLDSHYSFLHFLLIVTDYSVPVKLMQVCTIEQSPLTSCQHVLLMKWVHLQKHQEWDWSYNIVQFFYMDYGNPDSSSRPWICVTTNRVSRCTLRPEDRYSCIANRTSVHVISSISDAFESTSFFWGFVSLVASASRSCLEIVTDVDWFFPDPETGTEHRSPWNWANPRHRRLEKTLFDSTTTGSDRTW